MIATVIIVVIAILGVIAAFLIGRNSTKDSIQEIQDNNDQILKQKEQLEKEITELNQLKTKEEAERRRELDKLDSDISWKWKEYYRKEEDIKRINRQYQEKLEVIHNTKQLADAALAERRKTLETEYLEYAKEHETLKQEMQNELNSIKEELDSLKSTKAATIEAARKEQEITENKDAYCLILPREEERDISLLREVQTKVSKPRAVAMCIWNGWYQPLAKVKFPKILGKQDVCGIYKITNQKTGECYIGQAVDVRKRWYEHSKAMIGIDTPSGNKLYAAAREYGLDDFSFELLEQCKSNELDEKEKYFIELYNAKVFGYNGTAGNNG